MGNNQLADRIKEEVYAVKNKINTIFGFLFDKKFLFL